MGELIDKDELMEDLGISYRCKDCSYVRGDYCGTHMGFADACEAICDAKPVEAIPVQWIIDNYIKDRPADESVPYMVMVNKWREEKNNEQT